MSTYQRQQWVDAEGRMACLNTPRDCYGYMWFTKYEENGLYLMVYGKP